jgi:hypothetical protein
VITESDNLRGAVSLRLPSAPIAVSSLVVSPKDSVDHRIASTTSEDGGGGGIGIGNSGAPGSNSNSNNISGSSDTTRRLIRLRRSGPSSALYLCYAEHPLWHQYPRPSSQSLAPSLQSLLSSPRTTACETTHQLRQSRALFLTALSSSGPSDSEGGATATVTTAAPSA